MVAGIPGRKRLRVATITPNLTASASKLLEGERYSHIQVNIHFSISRRGKTGQSLDRAFLVAAYWSTCLNILFFISCLFLARAVAALCVQASLCLSLSISRSNVPICKRKRVLEFGTFNVPSSSSTHTVLPSGTTYSPTSPPNVPAPRFAYPASRLYSTSYAGSDIVQYTHRKLDLLQYQQLS